MSADSRQHAEGERIVQVAGTNIDLTIQNGPEDTRPHALHHPGCDDCQVTLGTRRDQAWRFGRLRRSLNRLAQVQNYHDRQLDSVQVHAYRTALVKLLTRQEIAALCLFQTYDARVGVGEYSEQRFLTERTLRELTFERTWSTLTVLQWIGEKARRPGLRNYLTQRLANLLAEAPAHDVVSELSSRQEARRLSQELVAAVVLAYADYEPLGEQHQTWRALFRSLPTDLLPDLFEVHEILSNGTDLVRLADTPQRQQVALQCCLRSTDLEDVQSGIELASAISSPALKSLHRQAGRLLFQQRSFAQAAHHYELADDLHDVSVCYERLEDYIGALAECPVDELSRQEKLVALCLEHIDRRAERQEFKQAVISSVELIAVLEVILDPEEPNPANRLEQRFGDRLREAEQQRSAVLRTARSHYGAGLRDADPRDRVEVLRAWSCFEEAAEEYTEAANWAIEADDRKRAARLFRKGGQFGQAERVLSHDQSLEGLATRAESLESGGDLSAAARLREAAADQHQDPAQAELAIALYLRLGRPGEAANCLQKTLGDNAVDDARYATFLREAGETDRLVQVCVRSVRNRPDGRRAAQELRDLRREQLIPEALEAEVAAVLAAADRERRRPFEARVQKWVEQARQEVDTQFASIWGLDLGTSTCAVAIYDRKRKQNEVILWQGKPGFPSTFTVDPDGTEFVGLQKDEILDERREHILRSKRMMGTDQVFPAHGHSYRAEEIAARFIAYARTMVENRLIIHVQNRVAALAKAEIGQPPDEWIDWAAEHYDMRLPRDKAVLSIPAYFTNNQKYATRKACEIAKVQAVRLVHEPTAAAMSIVSTRGLTGQVVVADLGAGTLDLSCLTASSSNLQVKKVSGDTELGGQDFDAAVQRWLTGRLETSRFTVARGMPELRLQLAAEELKVALSTQAYAECTLPGFINGATAQVEMNQSELAHVIADPLDRLRATCSKFRDQLGGRPDYLVLVGGPMNSPAVRRVVEEAIGAKKVMRLDPLTAVAMGAALQAAVLDKSIEKFALRDVNPLPLGLQAVGKDGRASLSEQIAANAPIPVKKSKTYTTHRDAQPDIHLQIFNGSLESDARIGTFVLDRLPPAPAGVPQIEVTFEIDESCVLEVTARDLGTGHVASIKVQDTTLLTPEELQDMTRRFAQHQARETDRRERQRLLASLSGLITQAEEDADAAFVELDALLSAFRPVKTLDPQTDAAIMEAHNPATRLEMELSLTGTRRPLADLAERARRQIASRGGDLAPMRDLESELNKLLGPRRSALAWARHKVFVLRSAGASELDPIEEFRRRYAERDYVGALTVLGRHALPEGKDQDQLRHCAAEVGDEERYWELLPPPGRDEEYLESVVRVRQRSGTSPASGFLIDSTLVVTTGKVAAHQDLQVVVADEVIDVQKVWASESTAVDLAILQLAEPAASPPLRLGHSKLLHLADPVWALSRPSGQVRRAAVEKFEPFPERNLKLFRTVLPVGSESSGGPVFNEHGEVVGILVVNQHARGRSETFALTVDMLDPLLRQASFSRPGHPRAPA